MSYMTKIILANDIKNGDVTVGIGGFSPKSNDDGEIGASGNTWDGRMISSVVTLPGSLGASGEILQSNGDGTTEWVAP